MADACRAIKFSIARDGKYHDATYIVEGGVVSVLYWGPDGVTRREAPTDDPVQSEVIACQLLSQIVDSQPQFS